MRLNSILKKLFFEWEWLCAYRCCDQSFDLENQDTVLEFKVISIKKGFWAADPFLVNKENHIFCFFEYYSKKKRKAAIFGKELYPKEGNEFLVHEFDGHSSYPCIFEFDGNYYMIPETKYSHSIRLLKCTEWPNKWEEIKVLMNDVDAVDSTFYSSGNESYLFVFEEKEAFNQLSLHKFNMNTLSLENVVFKKQFEKGEARPGGSIISANGKEYRVVQPFRDHYGEKLEFFEMHLEKTKYEERLAGELLPQQIRINKNGKIIGVHTFNRNGSIEVIDVLLQGHFSLFRPIKWIFGKIGIFGYGRYDDKQKYLFKKQK